MRTKLEKKRDSVVEIAFRVLKYTWRAKWNRNLIVINVALPINRLASRFKPVSFYLLEEKPCLLLVLIFPRVTMTSPTNWLGQLNFPGRLILTRTVHRELDSSRRKLPVWPWRWNRSIATSFPSRLRSKPANRQKESMRSRIVRESYPRSTKSILRCRVRRSSPRA